MRFELGPMIDKVLGSQARSPSTGERISVALYLQFRRPNSLSDGDCWIRAVKKNTPSPSWSVPYNERRLKPDVGKPQVGTRVSREQESHAKPKKIATCD
jgi:hypothetical protein